MEYPRKSKKPGSSRAFKLEPLALGSPAVNFPLG